MLWQGESSRYPANVDIKGETSESIPAERHIPGGKELSKGGVLKTLPFVYLVGFSIFRPPQRKIWESTNIDLPSRVRGRFSD
jgi:hypothetical protein